MASSIKIPCISLGEATIPFYEDKLIAQLGEDGQIYVALRPIVESLGLDWSAQYRRIKRDLVLSEEIKTISVAITATEMRQRGEGAKDYICLPKQFISGFLFGINANRVQEELREHVIKWQREVHLFLDAAFTDDAESAMAALRQKYLRQGYDEAWIKQRQITIATRNQLTDEWKSRSVQHGQYGVLTAVIHRGAFGMNSSDYKQYKGVAKGEVRDHMTGLELGLSMLLNKPRLPISTAIMHKATGKTTMPLKSGAVRPVSLVTLSRRNTAVT